MWRQRLLRLGVAGVVLCAAGERLVASDCNGNLVDDVEETILGLSTDCNRNALPDECDVRPASFGFGAWKAIEEDFSDLVAGDLDGDGDMDLVGLDYYDELHIHLNDGSGTFEETYRFPASAAQDRLALADIDADGVSEILYTEYRGVVHVYAFRRGMTPILSRLAFVTAQSPSLTLAPDLDGDGDLDLVVKSSDSIVLFENRGGFEFDLEPRTSLDLERVTFPVLALDADLDGDADLVAWERITGQASRLALVRNLGSWSFASVELDSPPTVTAVAADFDQDGSEDLALAHPEGIRVLRNDPASASFRLAATLQMDDRANSLIAADLDGDGAQDLVAEFLAQLTVFVNSGNGSFQARPVSVASARTYGASLAAGDLDRDGDPDLVLGTFSRAQLLENRPLASSLDCDRDGIPDECGPAFVPACEDCDKNGIPDVTDMERGAADGNRNGILDLCEAEVDFHLRFHAPGTVTDSAGTPSRFPAQVQVLSLGVTEEDGGVQGWSIQVGVDGGRITQATTLGTLAGPPPAGLFSNGFERTGLFEATTCKGGAFSAVVLSLMEALTLPLTPSEILRLEVESSAMPAAGGVVRLSFPLVCSNLGVVNADGAGANHQIQSLVTWQGSSLDPSTEERAVRLIPASFRRGDANSDGKVDISDAIRTFMFLFLGASAPHCLDTADANDDGAVDISDGLHILNDFFREGTGIPDPGPFDCGIDPTSDGVSCTSFASCR